MASDRSSPVVSVIGCRWNEIIEICSASPPNSLPELPPEVWQVILNKLEGDNASLWNCTRTCTSWEELLQRQRNDILFALAFPAISDYLDLETLRNCRLVSSRCKQLVDTCLENQCSLNSSILEDGTDFTDKKFRGAIFQSFEEIVQFLADIGDTELNPFPSRSVNLKPNEDLEEERIYADFTFLLRKFGHHIWHLVYDCPHTETTPEPYIQLEWVFLYCENLKSFGLRLNQWRDLSDYNQCLSWLRVRHLPKMLNLETLLIYGSNVKIIAAPIMKVYGRQLKQLHVSDYFLFKNNKSVLKLDNPRPLPPPRLQSPFPNLRELKLCVSSSTMIERISKYDMPLESLHLQFPYPPPSRSTTQKISFRSLLRSMNAFSTTLVKLAVPVDVYDVYNNNPCGMVPEIEVTFPKLTYLQISFSLLRSPLLKAVMKKFPSLKRLSLVRVCLIKEKICFDEEMSVNEDNYIPSRAVVKEVKKRVRVVANLCSSTLTDISVKTYNENWTLWFRCKRELDKTSVRLKCSRISVNFV